MKINTWEKIEAIYDQALAIDVDERLKFVQAKTKGDNALYIQVIKMLSSEDGFMEVYPGLISNVATVSEQIPISLDHFKIIKKVATGGMGRVYLAQSMNADVDIYVALKTIRIELLNKDLKVKFQNEKEILSKLQHKNIAKLIDAGVSQGDIPYIATEWIEGESIVEYCRHNRLKLKDRLRLFQQMCAAVCFAHNKLIIHRDIKPDNILVDGHGQVKLLDFGIAKIIDENQNKNTQTQIFTPNYAAPEQINGQPCAVTTDVYSLGVVLFEMLTQNRRFNLLGLSISQKIKAVCSPKGIDLKNLPTQEKLPYPVNLLKGELINIINKATHFDQSRRYESVSALTSDVKNYLNQRPVTATKDNLFYHFKMFILRNTLASFLTATVLITAVVGMYWNNKQVQLKLQEAQKSQVMLTFFKDVLNKATPAQGGSFNMTVKQMFENGMAEFDFDAIENSYIKAEVAAQMAMIYSQLGHSSSAKKYNDMALDYYSFDLTNKKNASSYMQYALREASNLVTQKEFDQAIVLIDDIFAKVKGREVENGPMSLAYLYLGRIYGGLGENRDIEKSQLFFDQSQQLAEEIDDFSKIAEINYYKYQLYKDINSYEDSKKYVETAEKYFQKNNNDDGRNNQNLAVLRSDFADLLSNHGDLIQAEKEYKKSIVQHHKIFASDNYTTLINRAKNLLLLGQNRKALDNLTKAQTLFNQENRNKNINYYGLLMYKAMALTELKDFNLAGELYTQVLKFMQDLLPADHRIIKIVINHQADYYLKSNNLMAVKQTQKILLAFLENNDKTKHLKNSLIVTTSINLANSYLYLENPALAAKYYGQATSLVSKNIDQYQQSWWYWLLQTGSSLVNNKHIRFNTAKQQLLYLVSEDQWYDSFFKWELQ